MSLDDIIERDGARCVWCGNAAWRQDLTLEHVLPRSGGGSTTPENALVACRRCNRARGSRPVVAYVRVLRETGAEPQLPLIRDALERLRTSAARRDRAYGEKQLKQLERL